MDIAGLLFNLVGNHPALISFLSVFLGGEVTIVALAVLAAHAKIDLEIIFIFSYIGALLMDSIWFFFGYTKIFDWFVTRRHVSRVYTKWDNLLDKLSKKRYFEVLIVTKFIYGFRMITLMHLARKKFKVSHFLAYNLITNFVWISVVIMAGWLAGNGIKHTGLISNHITLFLFLVGICVIAFLIGIRFARQKVGKLFLL